MSNVWCVFLSNENKQGWRNGNKKIRIIFLGKAINAADGLGMKIPYQLLLLFTKEKYINVSFKKA